MSQALDTPMAFALYVLVIFRFMHSRGISYVNNILISLCPNILDTLSIYTPSARVICEAKVWRAMWKVSRFGM